MVCKVITKLCAFVCATIPMFIEVSYFYNTRAKFKNKKYVMENPAVDHFFCLQLPYTPAQILKKLEHTMPTRRTFSKADSSHSYSFPAHNVSACCVVCKRQQ